MFKNATLTVDLAAVVANWQWLRAQFSGDECAAVVKADGYGLGATEVAAALADAGCHSFFVATAEEAVELREALPDVRILVLSGVQEGEEFAFVSRRIIPVLNSLAQVRRWQPVAAEHVHAVSALHIDTGMGRLGLQPDEFAGLLAREPEVLQQLRTGLLMSHLACACDVAHPLNATQLDLFAKAAVLAPGIPASLCNSAGILLGKPYHFNLARPGCSLYGIAPQSSIHNPMRQVASWEAPILQVRTLERDQTIGYGATASAQKGAKIAAVASGYADGYLRAASNKSWGYIGNHRVKLIGRVTMDMLCFDVTAVPEAALNTATTIELLGDKDGIRVDDLADAAGTIGYEVLTRIGTRVERVYL